MTGQEDEDPTAPGHELQGVPLRGPDDGGMLQMGPMAGSHLKFDGWRRG